MVSGSNNIPELKIKAPIVVPTPRHIPTEATAKPRPEAARKLIQAPDSVHLSPRAQVASKVKAAVETTPEVRPARVQEATAKLRAQTPNSSALNAKLAEKLLTEI